MPASPGTITRLLLDWRNGDKSALDKLVPLVYREMRRLAGYYMRRQRPGHTLQTSALMIEAYLRLIDHKNMRWEKRSHFNAVADQAIRRILVDHAGAKMRSEEEALSWCRSKSRSLQASSARQS